MHCLAVHKIKKTEFLITKILTHLSMGIYKHSGKCFTYPFDFEWPKNKEYNNEILFINFNVRLCVCLFSLYDKSQKTTRNFISFGYRYLSLHLLLI